MDGAIDRDIHENEFIFCVKNFFFEKWCQSSQIPERFTSMSILTINSWYKMSWQPWGQVGKCWIHSACGGPSLMKFWLQLGLFEPVKMEGSDFTQLDILNSKIAYFRPQKHQIRCLYSFWKELIRVPLFDFWFHFFIGLTIQ